MTYQLPVSCPSCGEDLRVKSMHCNSCGTTIEGNYMLPLFTRLSKEDQNFILSFIKNSGSLKQMAKDMELSYPTVRNMLNNLIKRIETLESQKAD